MTVRSSSRTRSSTYSMQALKRGFAGYRYQFNLRQHELRSVTPPTVFFGCDAMLSQRQALRGAVVASRDKLSGGISGSTSQPGNVNVLPGSSSG